MATMKIRILGTPLSEGNVEATYRITEADYVRAVNLHGKRSLRGIAIWSATVLVLLGIAAFGPPHLSSLVIGGLIGIAIVIPVGRYIIVPIRSHMHYRRYKAMHVEATIEVVEDGIRFSTRNGQGRVPWENILKWRQNDRYILVYQMPRLFHIVPKSIASSGFDVSAFERCLTCYVGNPA
jgi:hypothetical protein